MVTIKQLGIGKVKAPKYTSISCCKELATHYIGDIKAPYKQTNVYVNENQLKQLYLDISAVLGTPPEAFKCPTANDNPLYEEYVKYLYSTSNSATKAGLMGFCKSHDINLPDNTDDLKVKDYLDLIFPELKE